MDYERDRVKRGEITAADRQEDRRRTVGQERLSVPDPVASLVAGNRHIFRTLQNEPPYLVVVFCFDREGVEQCDRAVYV